MHFRSASGSCKVENCPASAGPEYKRLSLSTIGSLPFVDRCIDHGDLLSDSKSIITALFPEWNGDDLELTQCRDGTTNKLVRVSVRKGVSSGSLPRTVLIRTYGIGTEYLIDREQELVNLVALSRLNLAPPVYGRFHNGIVYGFVNGRVVGVDELRDPHISLLIARRMAMWHTAHVDNGTGSKNPEPQLFKIMRRWLDLIPNSYSNSETQKRYKENFKEGELTAQLDLLETKLHAINPYPTVFSHNDLLSANIIYNEQKDQVYFIDYEYGSYNYRGFDIANHFCEFAGFEGDYSKYPNEEFQRAWLAEYWSSHQQAVLRAVAMGTALPVLSHTASNNDLANKSLEPPSKAELDDLVAEVNAFSLASHFFWGLWALVQAQVSDIEFDYIGYAIVRFKEYSKRKDQFLP